MEKNDILKGLYEDFFGINKLSKENQELAREIEQLNKDFPKIEVKPIENKELSKEQKDEKMKELFEKIDILYIEDKSKEILKKILEYVRKYNEKTEKQYISFDMCVYTDNNEILEIENGMIKDEIVEEIKKERLLVKKQDSTILDGVLICLCFVFDLNFKYSVDIILERDLINKIINRFDFKDKKTKENIEIIRKILNKYIRNDKH